MKLLVAMPILMALSVFLCGAEAATELRGAWVSGDGCKNKGAADALLRRAETLNLNSPYVLVFHTRGHALYRSDIVPTVEDVEGGFDPLAYPIEEGHKRGLQIHAWFVNGEYGWGPQDGVLDQRPSWRAMDLRAVAGALRLHPHRAGRVGPGRSKT